MNDVLCHFISQDILQISFHEPNNTLHGVPIWYSIDATTPELILDPLTTNDTVINVTLINLGILDLYKSYNIGITAINTGSSGPTTVCSIFIPNGKWNYVLTKFEVYTFSYSSC